MNLTLHSGDQTLALFPIECGWGDPNCLGGYSSILSASDAAAEGGYGRWGLPSSIPFNETVQSRSADDGAFNCFAGTPRRDANGNWYCDTSNIIQTRPAETQNETVRLDGGPVANIAGIPVSRNLLIGGAILLGAILFLKGDDNGRRNF